MGRAAAQGRALVDDDGFRLVVLAGVGRREVGRGPGRKRSGTTRVGGSIEHRLATEQVAVGEALPNPVAGNGNEASCMCSLLVRWVKMSLASTICPLERPVYRCPAPPAIGRVF